MKSSKKQFSILLLTAVVSTSIMITGCQNTNKTEETQTTSKQEVSSKTVKITDMNGRDIEIPSPKELKKVYYPSPLGQLMIYTVNPDKMVGVVSELKEQQLKFMPKAKGLKVMGNFDGGKDINIEEVLATGAQVLISMGPNLPFSWIDRPPSSQQYLGLRYVGNVLYPDVFDYDMTSEVQKFFKLFYQVDISKEEVKTMLGESVSE